MVLYHADGTVVKTHDTRLEKEAQAKAESCRYTDPIEQAGQIIVGRQLAAEQEDATHADDDERVKILVDPQIYSELYYSDRSSLRGEYLTLRREESDEFPSRGIDRRTLMKCSSTAYDFFTLKPEKSTLNLPVCYPRVHAEGWDRAFINEKDKKPDYAAFVKWYEEDKRIEEENLAYLRQKDDQMAFIRDHEIRDYLVPWLNAMEDHMKVKDKTPKDKASGKENSAQNILEKELHSLPTIEIPESLIEKIHLYNVMLQFGISSYFQQPLIDELIFQMYQTNLNQCHLDTLEMTVGRFYSRGVAILDPVLNHLIGTYAFRSWEDRRTDPDEKDRVLQIAPTGFDDRKDETEVYLQAKPRRDWLTYRNEDPGREEFRRDLVLHPPKLEVIGHCIRHWSGVRRRGESTAAAHTGYPLNVGCVKKYYRRRATSPIRKNDRPGRIDKAHYSTYRLHNLENVGRKDDFNYFRDNRPGNPATALPWKASGSTAPGAAAPGSTGPAGPANPADATGHSGAGG